MVKWEKISLYTSTKFNSQLFSPSKYVEIFRDIHNIRFGLSIFQMRTTLQKFNVIHFWFLEYVDL